MLLRIVFSITWLGLALGPMLAAALAMQMIASGEKLPAAPTATPNPQSVSPASLGPLEILAYADPWWAGVGLFWLVGGLILISLAVVLAVVFVDVKAIRPTLRGPVVISLAMFMLGLFFATPWFYGIYCLLVRA